MNDLKNRLNERVLYAISVMSLIIVYVITLVTTYIGGKGFLDADESSELVLARLLNAEGKIISPNWFYSTELRVLNTQLVHKISMALFSDWTTARTFSVAILMLILIGAYLFMGYELGLGKWLFWSAIPFVLPFSNEHFYVVIHGGFYVPHIAISFLIIGLIAKITNSMDMVVETGRKLTIILCIALEAALSLLSGLGGVRQGLILFAPLAVTAMFLMWYETRFEDDIKEIILSKAGIVFITVIIDCVFFVLGFAVNHFIYSKRYSFADLADRSLSKISLNEWWDYLDSGFTLLGYTGAGEISDHTGIAAIAALVMCMLLIFGCGLALRKFEKLNYNHRMTALYFVIGLGTNVLFYVLALNPVPRFLLPLILMLFPVYFIAFLGEKEIWSRIFVALLLFFLVVQSSMGVYYVAFRDAGILTPEEKAVEFLLENEYEQGVGTFWNCNNFVELSDGKIEMWDIEFSGGDDGYDIKEWLQEKRHVDHLPEGKGFIILNKDQLNLDVIKKLPTEHIIYDDVYRIYGYNEMGELFEELR